MKPKSALLLLFFAPLLIFASPLRGEEDHESKWKQINSQAWKAYLEGRYKEGISFAEDAYQYARKRLGDTHPDTITSMNNLAMLYDAQGRYREAELLYTNALQLRKKVLGRGGTERQCRSAQKPCSFMKRYSAKSIPLPSPP